MPCTVGQKAHGATTHRAWRPATHGRPKSRLGHGPVAQPSRGKRPTRPATTRAHRRSHHARTVRRTAWWRAHRRLSGGSTAAMCCRRSRGGHREGARQGGDGRGAPERWVDGEAAQTASGGGVQQRGVAPVVIDVRVGVLQHQCGRGKRDLAPIWEW
jgi:hypothetical protein